MPIPPDSIQVGKCYLTTTGSVRRAVRMLPGGRMQFEQRPGHILPNTWKSDVQDVRSFASTVEREVPFDWTPERDG
jgi:hypothetical protein